MLLVSIRSYFSPKIIQNLHVKSSPLISSISHLYLERFHVQRALDWRPQGRAIESRSIPCTYVGSTFYSFCYCSRVSRYWSNCSWYKNAWNTEFRYVCISFLTIFRWKHITCLSVYPLKELVALTHFLGPFLTLGLFGRRVIVVTCVCPSVRLSVILVNTITQSVYPISLPNLLGGFNMALSWMVL